jgi:hypothetical protein
MRSHNYICGRCKIIMFSPHYFYVPMQYNSLVSILHRYSIYIYIYIYIYVCVCVCVCVCVYIYIYILFSASLQSTMVYCSELFQCFVSLIAIAVQLIVNNINIVKPET